MSWPKQYPFLSLGDNVAGAQRGPHGHHHRMVETYLVEYFHILNLVGSTATPYVSEHNGRLQHSTGRHEHV